MTTFVVIVYIIVYLSMLLGGIPGLRVDRTGAALLGAIALLAVGNISEQNALASIDVPTLALLFGLMVVSAQFQLGGFYGIATKRVVAQDMSPPALLAVVISLTGAFSALLTNDVVCLAVAPLLSHLCIEKKLNPVPYLLALACAANIGSATTLIGNPQNILIGEALKVPFNGYLLIAMPPCLLGLLIVWGIIVSLYRGKWHFETEASLENTEIEFDRWQTFKGILVLTLLIACFIFTAWPRELLALGAAGILMLSRKFHSRKIMGLVDWSLLVLFISLFIVNKAFQLTGGMDWLVAQTESAGIPLDQPAPLFISTVILGNLVSNVPAIMLLLPIVKGSDVGPLLALSSSLAGNLIIVGSVANIIVVESARQAGIKIDFKTHARVGIPVTLVTLSVTGAWLWLVSLFS
ncbi:anion transporter [Gimesia aquarii]|uniref:Inner membrane protein YbiR n=1 Tax=Gimesia aquarii TaxID=2527964 RepID=A0A517W0K7_9PLAN|nr:anion transporter [Gimesia aquarii]QDT98788.1 Inner membrane protein YbiR [Gimesia aquarii]